MTTICRDGSTYKNGGTHKWCTYKDVKATNCTGGLNPGYAYSCEDKSATIEEAGQSAFYKNDFQGAVGSEWSKNTTDVIPQGNCRFLGQFGNETVTLNLRLSFTFPHLGQSLALKFSGSNLQAISDESWGLDNVRVSVH